MKKRISAIAVFFAVIFMTSAHAQDISVYLNNEKIEFDTAPIIEDGHTLVPMRAIMEALGFNVQWSSKEQRSIAFNENLSLAFFLNSDTMYINGEPREIDTPMQVINQRTMLPLRAFVEALGADISKNGDSIYINADIAAMPSCAQMARELFDLTNEVRKQNGLAPFAWHETAAVTGDLHCMDMANRHYFAHITPEGRSPFDRMKNNGIVYTVAAENIAAGLCTPKEAADAFMASPSHRVNILNPKLTSMGAAVYRGGDYGLYWAQEFIGE